MTAVAHGTRGSSRSLLGKLAAAVAVRGRPGTRGRLAAAAAAVREHVVTVAALASADMGAFHVPYGWGLVAGPIVTGVSMLAADFAIRG